MKTLLSSLALAGALCVASAASAAVIVHAGPVHVGVGRPVVRPIPAHRPVVVRPAVARAVVVPAPRPVVIPAPVASDAAAWRAAAALRAAKIRAAVHEELEEAVEGLVK